MCSPIVLYRTALVFKISLEPTSSNDKSPLSDILSIFHKQGAIKKGSSLLMAPYAYLFVTYLSLNRRPATLT